MAPLNIILDPQITPGIFVAKMWIREGSRADPISKKGIHQLMGSILSRGCGPYNNIQVADLIEGSGAGLRCETYEDGLLISLKCIENDYSYLLPVIGWMITSPGLEIDQINLEKELSIQSIKRQSESPFHLAFNGWRELVYSKTPYEHDPSGTIESLKNISQRNLNELLQQIQFRRKDIVIAGSFPKKIDSELHEIDSFSQLQETQEEVRVKENSPSKYKISSHSKTVVIQEQETNQVVMMLGKSTISHSDQDDLALRILSCHLGSGMSSKLFKTLREEYAVAYEVGVYHPIREYSAPFLIHASTSTDKAILTLELLRNCWNSIFNETLSEKELILAKAKFKGNVAHNLQTVSQKAERKVQLIGFQMKETYDQDCIKRIDYITPEEIRRIALKHLMHPVLSLCGPAKTLIRLQNQWVKS